MRPGVNIVISENTPIRTPPTDTGVWFLSGLADKGPTTSARLITSLSEYVKYFGDRVSYGILYDALDVFFREGGTRAYVTRVVGPANVTAFKLLLDAGAANTLRVEANSPGEWGNALNVQVVAGGAGGSFVLVISHDVLGELERSGDLIDKAAAFEWAENSNWIVLIDQASLLDPAVVAVQSLAGGLDDRASIVDAQWTTSLTRFSRDLGPGQVSFPGKTTTTLHGILMTHAAANNRVAILDFVDTPTKATFITEAELLRGANAKWTGVWQHWLLVPGITPGTTRTVPPSALIAAKAAYADSIGSPNTPGAGDLGIANYVTGLSQPTWNDLDLQELNGQGVNSIIMKYGVPRVFGWRTLADPDTDSEWNNMGNSRLIMQIAAEADALGETYLFDEIDGQGRVIASYGGALTAMLMPYWNIGSLYGLTAEEAFQVDVGPSVNTPTTIADKQLRALVMVRPSPFAEMITIEIVKQQVNE